MSPSDKSHHAAAKLNICRYRLLDSFNRVPGLKMQIFFIIQMTFSQWNHRGSGV